MNIWAFICGVFLLFINILGKSIKNDYIEEYAVRKIVESFLNMRYQSPTIDHSSLNV